MKQEISTSVKRVDGDSKIDGRAVYLDDLHFDDVLYAKTLRSTRPRAKLLDIEIPDLPEGYCIVDKSDVPGENRVKIVENDQPFFAEDKVNYIGEPILLVVGADREVIADIISKIKVNYQDMEPILTIEDAEEGRIQPIYDSRKCFADYEFTKGDIEGTILGASYFIEDEYKTGYQEHAYLETQAVVGKYEKGRITIYGSLQCPYYVKDAVTQGLGWDEKRVRVIQTTTGGAFGGKEDYPSLIGGHVAFAALKTGKTVKLVFDRSEDIEFTTKRHPSVINVKTYFDEFNKIVGRDIDIKLDAGPYSGLSNIVLQRIMFCSGGVYNIPNLRVRGRTFATNNVVSGAFRGFGGPQGIFAIEMHMENIAERLNIDSLELKKKYILKKGDTSSTGGVLKSDIKLSEIIDRIEKISGYKKRRGELNLSKNTLKGIGCSLFLHGCGFTGDGEKEFIKARVRLKKHIDKGVEILIANVEMGQGCSTTLRKIVGDVLQIPIENIIYNNPDTDEVPNSGPTVASRTIMVVGKLLKEAAEEMKGKWNENGEIEIEKNYRHPENMEWDGQRFQGSAYVDYSWGANMVEVEIDPITFELDITGIWSVFDIGKAIDEKIVRGQIEGGMVQGLGYGYIEVMNIKKGKLLQRNMTDYIVPTSMDFPPIKSELVENPSEHGPFGAKGLGEITHVGTPAALALAVQNALGIPIKQIPVTPEYLRGLVKNEK